MSESLKSSPSYSGDQDIVMSDDTMNHLTYKATNGVPYLIDYLGLKDMYEVNPMVTEMARELHTLFVTDDSETQIHETKMELDSLSQELNLNENDAPIYKLRKLLNLAKIRDRLNKNERMRLQMVADSEVM